MNLAQNVKTIKPLPGGFLGGEKYIVANIYFKFALDQKKLFIDCNGDASAVFFIILS